MFARSFWLAAFATSAVYASSQKTFFKGFDLSSLKIQEDGGAIYKDAQDGNVTKPVEEILEGMNTVRLRLWVNPTVPYDGGCRCRAAGPRG